jgi:hypothetical protein
MDGTLRNYLPLTGAEAGALCETLRILKLSIVWYGTRDHSWERLARFTATDIAPFLRNTSAMIEGKLRVVRRRRSPELSLLTIARLLFHHWTGWYTGYAWVDDELLREIGREVKEFLRLTENPCPETDDPLFAVLHSIWESVNRLGSLAPSGRPREELRFFGCEDYGKCGPWPEVRRSA